MRPGGQILGLEGLISLGKTDFRCEGPVRGRGMNKRTNRRTSESTPVFFSTNRRTDKASYRVAWPQLKRKIVAKRSDGQRFP